MLSQAQRSLARLRRLRLRSAAPLDQAVHLGLHGERGRAGIPRAQRGISLLELMLVAGAIAVGSAIVYGVYQNVDAASKVNDESGRLRQVTQNILDAYSASEDYGNLTTQRALEDRLFPEAMVIDGGSEARSGWGTDVRVLATDVVREGQTLPNWGFVIAYDNVPAKACVDLISNAGRAFNDIRIEGVSVGSAASLDPARMGELCNRDGGADVQFVYERSASKNPGGALNLCSDSLPGAPQTQAAACPTGEYGIVMQSRSAFCTSSYASYQWTPWSTVNQMCSPCPAPETRENTQTVACPAGQDGTWNQVRTEARSADCPKPGPGGPTELADWHPWVATSGWETTVNTCAPLCELPNPSQETRWTLYSEGCPTGQAGDSTWEQAEERTASCPPVGTGHSAPVGAAVWSPWAATGATRNPVNTCMSCPPPQEQTLACPTGQTGTLVQERSFACFEGGGWSDWTTTSSTCTACPGPQTQTVGCPTGQTGSIVQSRTFSCTEQGGWSDWTTTSSSCSACPPPQVQTLQCPTGQSGYISQSRSYDCAGQSGWGAWSTTANTCTACPGPESDVRWSGCPAFQSGFLAEERTRSYDCASSTWGQWTAWSTIANTCVPPPCDGTLDGNARNYMARYPELATQFGTNYTAAYQHWYTTGYQQGRQSCWAAPCTLPTPSSQTNQQVLSCPSGQYGSVTQQQQRTATCPAPTGAFTWGGWSAWANVSGACLACPAPGPQYSYRWSSRNGNCPPGQSGGVSWEAEQRQSRTATYSCPAGSTTLPPPTLGTPSIWSDTGQIRNYVNTCAPIGSEES